MMKLLLLFYKLNQLIDSSNYYISCIIASTILSIIGILIIFIKVQLLLWNNYFELVEEQGEEITLSSIPSSILSSYSYSYLWKIITLLHLLVDMLIPDLQFGYTPEKLNYIYKILSFRSYISRIETVFARSGSIINVTVAEY